MRQEVLRRSSGVAKKTSERISTRNMPIPAYSGGGQRNNGDPKSRAFVAAGRGLSTKNPLHPHPLLQIYTYP